MRFILAWVVASAISTTAGVLGGFAAAMLAYLAANRLGIFGFLLGAALYPTAGFVLGAVVATGQYVAMRAHLPIAARHWVVRSGFVSALLLMPAFIVGSYAMAPIAFLFPEALRAPLVGRLLVGLHFAAIGALMGAGLGWAQRAELHRVGVEAPRWTLVNALGAAAGCGLVLGALAFAPEGALGRGVGGLIRSGPMFGLVGATAALVTGPYLTRSFGRTKAVGVAS